MSNDHTASNPSELAYRPRVLHAVKTMPRWKWRLLGLALLVGLIGAAGQVTAWLNGSSAPAQAPSTPSTPAVRPTPSQTNSPTGAPANSNGFVSGSPTVPTPSASTPSAAPTPAPTPTITQTTTPFMTRVGFSLFVGVVVGLLFRTFIRLALSISALIFAAAMALSFFHINIDMTMVRSDSAMTTHWLTDQAYRLKGMLFHALPSSTSASLGFIFGFKKR